MAKRPTQPRSVASVDLKTKDGQIAHLESIVQDPDAKVEDQLKAMRQMQTMLGISQPEEARDLRKMSQEELELKIKRLLSPLLERHILEVADAQPVG